MKPVLVRQPSLGSKHDDCISDRLSPALIRCGKSNRRLLQSRRHLQGVGERSFPADANLSTVANDAARRGISRTIV